MYKRIENNSENNRQYLAISRRGPIHTCTVKTVRGEKMACTTVVAQRNHTFTLMKAFGHLQEALLETIYIYTTI